MPLVKSPTNIDTVTIILSLRQITPTTRAIASPISFTAMVRIPSRLEGITPLLSKTFNDRGQMDLIDTQSNIYDGMTWILHYQDHLTKFSYI